MFENKSAKHGDIAIGIDIGTTTISASVIDLTAKKQIDAFTVNYSANIISPDFSEQSVDVIINEAEMLLNKIHIQYRNIVSIGLTGQMHGIAYVDKDGNAISHLMNWQDKRADKSIFDGRSTCEIIKHITGEKIATGYGLATHFYNSKNGLVPADAVSFGSIMDILGMKLCGIKKPVIHTSVAASFGLFDLKNGCFMKEKCALLGIDKKFLPEVTDEKWPVGEILLNKDDNIISDLTIAVEEYTEKKKNEPSIISSFENADGWHPGGGVFVGYVPWEGRYAGTMEFKRAKAKDNGELVFE